MKTKEEILAEISDVLADEFEIPREKLVADAKLYEDLDLDSIDAVDLVVRIQQRTGIKVVADDFKTIRTLGDVAGVIAKLVAAQCK
jgi:acyl carrier protein